MEQEQIFELMMVAPKGISTLVWEVWFCDEFKDEMATDIIEFAQHIRDWVEESRYFLLVSERNLLEAVANHNPDIPVGRETTDLLKELHDEYRSAGKFQNDLLKRAAW